jgi:hypothetical protein
VLPAVSHCEKIRRVPSIASTASGRANQGVSRAQRTERESEWVTVLEEERPGVVTGAMGTARPG